jgi:hypothetical protein
MSTKQRQKNWAQQSVQHKLKRKAGRPQRLILCSAQFFISAGCLLFVSVIAERRKSGFFGQNMQCMWSCGLTPSKYCALAPLDCAIE